MSLILNPKNISERLSKKKIKKTPEELVKYLLITKNNYYKFSQNLHTGSFTKHLNPLVWQMGHVLFFYLKLILPHLSQEIGLNIPKLEERKEFYDSYLTPLAGRKGSLLLNYTECMLYYQQLVEILENFILTCKLTSSDVYLLMLGILHNEMHNEAFIFTSFHHHQTLHNSLKIPIRINFTFPIINEIKLITYQGGSFIQGSNENSEYLTFDNEMPAFPVQVNKFKISKYPITENQYLEFIESRGYERDNFWSENGLLWKRENRVELPLYWIKNKNGYFKKINQELHSVKTNLPIIHISYYEAQAFCSWLTKKIPGARLPTETEYEYVATNQGETRFPWDNQREDLYVNWNYQKHICAVNLSPENKMGVGDLIGNCWEWCQEPIYPYDGFTIDPIYREMSYPFFGFKKICKGGCFATPDFLIHPRYRNAQYPDCRIQFIGFRVATST